MGIGNEVKNSVPDLDTLVRVQLFRFTLRI